MAYEYLNSSIEREHLVLPDSDKINPFLLKNNQEEIIKALDFFATDEKFLYVYGFMGSGKRQFINYLQEFLNDDVIVLEYFCKEATVCDDILLEFTRILEANAISKAVNINAKITTLDVKFKQITGSEHGITHISYPNISYQDSYIVLPPLYAYALYSPCYPNPQ